MTVAAELRDRRDASGDASPVPRRYWWLRRLAVAGACFVVFLVLLRLVWGWEANRRLEAEIERYRAAGQPVYAREFDAVLDAVPDEENAALLYEKAIASVVSASAAGLTIDDFYRPDAAKQFTENANDAREIVEANRAVLAIVREARDRPQVAWSARLEGSAAAGLQTMGVGQRDLLKLLWMTATQQRLDGDHAAAFETFKDAVAMCEAIGSHPTLIANIVAVGSERLALTIVEDMTGGIRFDSGNGSKADGVRPVSREVVKALALRLLDQGEVQDAALMSRYGDRAYYLDILDAINRRGLGVVVTFRSGVCGAWDRALGFVQRPLFTLDLLRAMNVATLSAGAIGVSDWPNAVQHLEAIEENKSMFRSFTSPLINHPFGDDRGWVHRVIELNFQSLATRRMAATALAILLYEHDHGRRPATLAELAPEYLPGVPVDPFSPDGAEIRYRADAERPRLYSVGSDGVDDGGMTLVEALERGVETRDIHFDLGGRKDRWTEVLASRPSGEAVDYDHDPEEGEREQDEQQSSQGEPE